VFAVHFTETAAEAIDRGLIRSEVTILGTTVAATRYRCKPRVATEENPVHATAAVEPIVNVTRIYGSPKSAELVFDEGVKRVQN
jgi:hypothetical protein